MGFLEIAMGIGSLFQVGGAVAKGQSDAAQAEQEASRRNAQALEVENKARRDEIILREEGRDFAGDQASGYAKGGVALSGSPLLTLQSTAYKLEEQVQAQRRASAFQAEQFRSGARSLMDQASSSRVSGWLGGGAGLLTGAADIYKAKK